MVVDTMMHTRTCESDRVIRSIASLLEVSQVWTNRKKIYHGNDRFEADEPQNDKYHAPVDEVTESL